MANLKRYGIPSPNYSGRSGPKVRLIVLHTAEGARNYEDLGYYFQGPVDASSHVGIDDNKGECGQYVQRGSAAWTAANANPCAIQAEICGFASWTTSTWKNGHPNMLSNAAQWIAEEAAYFGIPITKLTPAQAQGSGKGVCQHKDLGSWGGGHVDCGSGFPIDYVLDMARGGGSAPTSEILPMSEFLPPDGKNVPLSLPKQASYVRFFATESIQLTITFAPQGNYGANKEIGVASDSPNGVNVPEGCNALIVRRGDKPANGYPLVSYAVQQN